MNLQITKQSGDYSIIASGSAITFSEGTGLDFSLKFDDESKLDLNISFQKNEIGNRGVSVYTKEQKIFIVCINFDKDNYTGAGTTRAITLADYNGEKVLFHFWVYNLGTLKKVDYCFFMKELVE